MHTRSTRPPRRFLSALLILLTLRFCITAGVVKAEDAPTNYFDATFAGVRNGKLVLKGPGGQSVEIAVAGAPTKIQPPNAEKFSLTLPFDARFTAQANSAPAPLSEIPPGTKVRILVKQENSETNAISYRITGLNTRFEVPTPSPLPLPVFPRPTPAPTR